MARLFIGQREVDFVSDITKEIVKEMLNGNYRLHSEVKHLQPLRLHLKMLLKEF